MLLLTLSVSSSSSIVEDFPNSILFMETLLSDEVLDVLEELLLSLANDERPFYVESGLET